MPENEIGKTRVAAVVGRRFNPFAIRVVQQKRESAQRPWILSDDLRIKFASIGKLP